MTQVSTEESETADEIRILQEIIHSENARRKTVISNQKLSEQYFHNEVHICP